MRPAYAGGNDEKCELVHTRLGVQSEPRLRGGSDFLSLPLDLFRSPASGDRLLDPIQRGMTSVLHLDPVRRPAGAIDALPALRNQALKAEFTRLPKQVRAYLALFKVRNENAFRSARQQTRQIGLAHGQRQFPQILATERQDIERVKLHLVIVPARGQPAEIADAANAEPHGHAIAHE